MQLPFRKPKNLGRHPINQAGKPRAAFSYYAGDAPRKQDPLKTRARNEQKQAFFKRLRLMPTLLAVGAIVLSVAYSTTLSQVPGLKYAGEPSPYRSTSTYKAGIEKVLESSVWNRSKLTINTAATEKALKKTFPEFDVVSVSLPVVGRRPTVTVHVRQPALMLTTANNVYVVDNAGKVVAFAKDLMSSTREKLPIVQDQSGLQVSVGTQALTSESVVFIMNILAQFNDKGLSVSSITLPPIPNEVDFRVGGANYFIKTDASGDARLQAGAYLAARESGLTATEYVDVRVEEKVFYK